MTDLKEKVLSVSIGSVISLVPTLVVLWVIAKPHVMDEIRAELMSEIMDKVEDEIQDEQRPLRTAYKEILGNGINVTRRAIAQLEHRRDTDAESWTSQHAVTLSDRYNEIQSMQRAYDAL